MSSTFINIPNTGSPQWKDPVVNSAALPSSNNTNGDARIDLSTDTIYVWNGSSWLAVATPGAAIAIDGLTGDVSASGPGVVTATVNSVGGSSAANIHSAELAANAATNLNTPSTIVKRDSLGNFSAGTITASLIGTASGNTTTASSPLSSSGGTSPNISIQNADSTHTGALTSTDWNTFNNKQPAGNYITTLTGDTTATGPGSVISTLKNIPNKVYVDFISGNDTNTGTITQPWKTLQHAYNSISPSINTPYVIYLSGGNNDTDVGTITGKADVSIIADYSIQIQPITITSPVGNSNGCTFVNLIFNGPLTWIRTDGLTSGVTFVNCEFFSGPIIKNTSTGSCSVSAFNSTFVNSEFQTANGGFAIFDTCDFLGTTTFDDPGSGGASYIEFDGGYSSGAMSFTGLYNPIYFTGFVHDVVFGASVSFSAGTAGPPPLEIDSNGLPPTFTGTPGAITYLSKSQLMNNTNGYAIGDVGAPIETNVLLSIKDGHIKSKQTTAPTITPNTNAGTGATTTLSNATDTAGIINLTTGTASFGAGIVATITFNKSYATAPIVIISPANAQAAADGGSAHHIYYPPASTTGFTINFGVQPNSSSTLYQWQYYVIETQ